MEGKKAREEAQQKLIIQEEGYSKRLELSKIGVKLLDEKRSELDKLKLEMQQLEPLKLNAEVKKTEMEKEESEAKEKHENAWQSLFLI